MFVLPFTKRARARDVALEELRPLLAMRGVPANFRELPYAVGFIIGYATAVAMEVTEDKASDNFVSDVLTGVLQGLVGSLEATLPVVRRFATWKNDPKFLEGRKNGNFFALFMHGSEKADATPLAVEVFRQARNRAPVFDQLREKTNERGLAAMILCETLFFERLQEFPAPTQSETTPPDWLANVVTMAEEHQKRVEDMTEKEALAYIKTILDTNDVVFGVWIDPEHPKGAGAVEIKSDPRFKMSAPNAVVKLKVSGVRCTREQALAAQQGVPVIPVVFELLPAKRMSEAEQVRFELETVSTVEASFKARPMFAVLAGAVFALHQDTLRAFAIDMRNIDVSLGVAIDKMRPSTLGNFPKRVRLTVDALHQIDDFNLDQRDKYNQKPPPGTDAKEYQFQLMLAAMRLTAARVWLLTIYSKIKEVGGGSNPGVMKIWSMLQTVSPSDLHDEAKFFTGTFYNNVCSEPLDLTMWPHNP